MNQEVFIPKLIPRSKLLNDLRLLVVKGDRVFEEKMNMESPHVHNYLEIYFNEYADVSFLVNGEVRHVGYGDAVVSRANDTHVCIYEKLKRHKYFCMWIDVDKDSPLLSFFHDENFSPFYSFEDDVKKQLLSLFKTLYSLNNNDSAELERASCLLQILNYFKYKSKKIERNYDIPKVFQDLVDYINTNFSNIASVKELSNYMHYSEATLYRIFKKYTGASPKQYLESIKLSNAAKLLKAGESVKKACFESGFVDCSYFIVVFKKRFGITPNKYKNVVVK